METIAQQNFVPATWAKNLVQKFNLEFLGTLIQKSEYFDAGTQKNLAEQLDLIRSRAADETFRLAIIGEFSSGKSTFINALIGKRVLKTGSEATTAVATYIRAGEILEVVATPISGNAKKELKSENLDEIRDFISQLTADEKTSKTLARVDISVSAKFKISGLEIIDTPGFDSGEERGNRHRKVTENVVQNVADCVLVCVPAGKAGSRELKEFLKNNVPASVAKDAFFVLTHADDIDDDELDDVLAHAAREIQKTFEMECVPAIFPVNSANELREKAVPEWSDKFQAMVDVLRERLEKNRNRILRERLKNLALQLCTDLKKSLADRGDQIKERADFIKEHKVARIEQITDEMLSETESKLYDLRENHFEPLADSMGDRILEYAQSLADNSYELIARRIRNGCKSAASIQRDITDYCEGFAVRCQKEAQRECKRYQREIDEIRDDFIAEFERHYEGFSGLSGKIVSGFENDDFNFGRVDFDLYIGESEASEILGDLFGDLGTEIGDMLDDFWSAFTGGPSAKDRAIERCWNEVYSKLNEFYKEVRSEICQAIYEIPLNAQRKFQELAEKHKKKYGKRVGNLIRQQENELADLKQTHRVLMEELHELNNILRGNK